MPDEPLFEHFLLWMIFYVMYLLSVHSCHSERCSIKIVGFFCRAAFSIVGAACEMLFISGVH